MCRSMLLGLGVIALAAQAAVAADPSFAKDVQPFLKTYCLECHSGAKAKAGVRLDSFDSIVKGGKKGRKNLVPGAPDGSPIVTSTEGKSGHKMPPKKFDPQPTAKEIQVLRDWVKAGAKNDAAANPAASAVEPRIEPRVDLPPRTKKLEDEK